MRSNVDPKQVGRYLDRVSRNYCGVRKLMDAKKKSIQVESTVNADRPTARTKRITAPTSNADLAHYPLHRPYCVAVLK